MTLAIAVLAAIAIAGFLFARSRKKTDKSGSETDTTPALDAWIASALEIELAEVTLGFKDASTQERSRLAQSLRGNPDPEVVSKVEDKVKDVELEYVKYAHEKDVELTLRVRYEDGSEGSTKKTLPWSDVPEGVRNDFDKKSTTRVFRGWTFPWSRVRVA